MPPPYAVFELAAIHASIVLPAVVFRSPEPTIDEMKAAVVAIVVASSTEGGLGMFVDGGHQSVGNTVMASGKLKL